MIRKPQLLSEIRFNNNYDQKDSYIRNLIKSKKKNEDEFLSFESQRVCSRIYIYIVLLLFIYFFIVFKTISIRVYDVLSVRHHVICPIRYVKRKNRNNRVNENCAKRNYTLAFFSFLKKVQCFFEV